MKLRKKSVKPIGLKDITIVDDTKVRKAITAAALGNAMEWFDFGEDICNVICRRTTVTFISGRQNAVNLKDCRLSRYCAGM